MCFFGFLLVKVVRFFVCALSPDGGHRQRAQLHRHRLENFAACTTLAGFGTGTFLALNGYAEGAIDMELGPITVQNAGVGIILLAIASFVMWMLLHAQKDEGGAAPSLQPLAAPPPTASHPDAVFASLGWAKGLTYGKVGLITLALLPFINVFAIPVGLLLAWKVSQKQ